MSEAEGPVSITLQFLNKKSRILFDSLYWSSELRTYFWQFIYNKKKVKFFIDNLYPSDYISPVFLRPVYLRPGTNNSRPFFNFFFKRGWLQWFVQRLEKVLSALLWRHRVVLTMAEFAMRSWSSVKAAIVPLNIIPNGTARHAPILHWNGKPEIATLLHMSQGLLQYQKRRLIRSKHPREVTSNVAFDLQINPALLKERGFFIKHPFRFMWPALPHPPDFSSNISLTSFVPKR